jgi:hypothetical protein
MSTSPSGKGKAKRNTGVPRDRELDQQPARNADSPPAAADVNMPDEGYSDQDKPLVADSREVGALHDRSARNKGTLGVGTAGDAARPTKTGIHSKTIPPRGQM